MAAAKRQDVRVIGYARVSTDGQELARQRHEVLEYTNRHGWTVDQFIAAKASSRKGEELRCLDKLKAAVAAGEADVVVFAELSRLGRSVGEIARLVQHFVDAGAELHFIKERLQLRKGASDISTKVTLTIFSLLAEIERDLISERTKAGLAARKAAGATLGRPAGVSKLDPHGKEIRDLLAIGATQKAIAKRLGCTEATLSNWLKRSREVQPA